ncbi:uncharacterized protein K452DRAFT_165900 [Aplosporella prunicola CBS 121167]|uniref:Secreted protein n=1 Tax=Aplosporella prunicola CBS 121167 TaxID=1176127 RepID=A0A6A6AVI7_9PEZI|nr:uncharacterized protein K452DRAFT_165900 [Aplosporella prunicola CBS 121167]KAF2135700.1 hypothetical protein K452DRAFT_165900 [Aplosporella prunicola CBS 121167]
MRRLCVCEMSLLAACCLLLAVFLIPFHPQGRCFLLCWACISRPSSSSKPHAFFFPAKIFSSNASSRCGCVFPLPWRRPVWSSFASPIQLAACLPADRQVERTRRPRALACDRQRDAAVSSA